VMAARLYLERGDEVEHRERRFVITQVISF
jgi:hypothetical protein